MPAASTRVCVLLLVACSGCATFQSNHPLTSAAPSETTRHTLRVGKLNRSFYLHLPPHFTAQGRYPLVILLHGHNNNGSNVIGQTKMDAVADKYGFILAAPNGTGRFGRFGLTWNAGTCCGSAQEKHIDDVGFLATLIDTLKRVFPIDSARIAITGFSAGGMLALRVACDRPEIATVYANVQGTMPDTTCAAHRPVSMLLFAGDEDEDMKTEHEENKHRNNHRFATSAMGTFRFWAARDGCARHFIIEATNVYVDHIAVDCADGTSTRLLTVHAHPHAWPGGHKTWLFSPTPNPNIDASLVIAEFLEDHPRPSADSHPGLLKIPSTLDTIGLGTYPRSPSSPVGLPCPSRARLHVGGGTSDSGDAMCARTSTTSSTFTSRHESTTSSSAVSRPTTHERAHSRNSVTSKSFEVA
jgi:polyhydroxybutyrate depolymerase